MPEPVTLAVVGALVLTEGIKFLYGQAGELLKGWRARRTERDDPRNTPAHQPEAASVAFPMEAFEAIEATSVDWEAVAELESDLRYLRGELAEYADGIDEVGETPPLGLLTTIDALRKSLEAVYGVPILFKGEATGATPEVRGEAQVEQVRGYVAGIRARKVRGPATGQVRAREVHPGGLAIGLDADTIGE